MLKFILKNPKLKKLDKADILKILVGLVITLLLIIFNPLSKSFDSNISSMFTAITGERQPDSSIVIIDINSADIEQLGPWPIKRSYYALLINNLRNYDVKKIGIEVFLSAKFVSQAIYDNLLEREIKKTNNVVLSSLAGNIALNNRDYFTDSLSFPSPKLIDESVRTGHINYLNDSGVEIPLVIKNQNQNENAFCLSLLDPNTIYPEKIKINFISSWKKFKHYSLLEFFDMVRSKDYKLNNLKNKIILIGISDPQLSSTFQSDFDNELPGVALHAFALDNLINKRYFNDNYLIISVIVFVLLYFLLVILLRKNNNPIKKFLLSIIPFFIIAYLINQFLYLELAYSFFIIPITLALIIDSYFYLREKQNQLKGAVDETQILKKLLASKEKELSTLQTELDIATEENKDALLMKIKNLKENIDKLKDNEDDQKTIDIKSDNDEENYFGMVFKSTVMKNIIEVIKKAAPTDATILITGESGTGKELVARAIHSLSKRSDKKFIAVNCTALTETLLESELFGHVKGAFTGAVLDKAGKFEAADKGTIFLDEIGETSENFQVKLLRVLQFGEFDKVGSISISKVDVRVVSATNKDLKQLIAEKKFREDLYYRLNVINIHLPPLRERKEDIEPIIKHFLKAEGDGVNISLAALNSLKEYEWKGNVRELESVIKRALVFCKASGRNLIQVSDLPEDLIRSVKLNFEDLVIESLRAKNFSHSAINETAKELGNVNRTLVAENFRGYSLKILCDNNFDENKSLETIALTNNPEIIARVKTKLETWLTNIRKDISVKDPNKFEEVKQKLISKYKNLPQKFHQYLDEVIKHYLEI